MTIEEGGSPAMSLRQRAEACFLHAATTSSAPSSAAEIHQQFRELQLYQIELELQNDDLRKACEREEAARTRYRELYDFAPVGYLSLTAAGVIIETNLAAARILGRERSRLLAQPFVAFVDTPDVPVFNIFHQQIVLTDQHPTCTLALLDSGFPRCFVYLEGARSADASECRVAIIDCTARILAGEELQRTQTRLREHEMNELMHANRLAALGTVMAGLVHEFNHPAQVVILNQKSLRSIVQCCIVEAQKHHGPALGMLSWDEVATVAPALLTDIEHASEHLYQLISSVQSYAQPRDENCGSTDLTTLSSAAQAALQLVSSYARRRQVLIESDLGNAALNSRAPHSRLQQIIINLLLNAVQASSVGGTVRLACELIAGFSVVRISDDGPGIEPGILAHFGKSFNTSKSASGGSGLGILICMRLVETLKGSIDFQGRSPRGTMVTLVFPQVIPA